MATKISTTYVDDLDGTEIADGGTVRFGLDGAHYEIDLSTANADALRTALRPYVDVARKAPNHAATETGRRRRSGSSANLNTARRDWLRQNGHNVGAKGRISPALLALVPANVLEIVNGTSGQMAIVDVVRETGPADGDTTGTVSVVTTPEQTAAILDGATDDAPAADAKTAETPAETAAPTKTARARTAKTPATKTAASKTGTAKTATSRSRGAKTPAAASAPTDA